MPDVRLIQVGVDDGLMYGAIVPADYLSADLDGYGLRCSKWVWEQIEQLVAEVAQLRSRLDNTVDARMGRAIARADKEADDDRRRDVLQAIAADAKADAKAFDGEPFNGRTVATYLGNQGAAIAALADIIATLLPDGSEAVA